MHIDTSETSCLRYRGRNSATSSKNCFISGVQTTPALEFIRPYSKAIGRHLKRPGFGFCLSSTVGLNSCALESSALVNIGVHVVIIIAVTKSHFYLVVLVFVLQPLSTRNWKQSRLTEFGVISAPCIRCPFARYGYGIAAAILVVKITLGTLESSDYSEKIGTCALSYSRTIRCPLH